MSKTIKRILLGLLGVLVIIQFFQINKTNPPIEEEQDFLYLTAPPSELGMLIKNVCYDCHSHESVYPWYSYIQPVGWWLKGHIDEAREHLNFSEWSTYDAEDRAHHLEEAAEEVEGENMPLPSYTWIHGEARLTDTQRSELVAWFEAQHEKQVMEEPRLESGEAEQEGEEHEHESGEGSE